MKNNSKHKLKVSPETQDEALKIARGTQKPGQTKEQTKLIAQGIQKGIVQYKKQHKARSRELNKQLKTIKHSEHDINTAEIPETIQVKQHWLPWCLLGLSWVGFLVYIIFND